MSAPEERFDCRRNEAAGADAWDVLCLACGQVRGAWSRRFLPEPGPCARCRGRSDLHTYWTRDWPKSQRRKEED